MTTIGNSAFEGCSNLSLTSVTIPNSVTSLGQHAFYLCSGLTSVTLSNSLTQINTSTFYGCTRLTSVEIPIKVTKIYASAFSECSRLESVTVYARSCSMWVGDAFTNCTALKNIYVFSDKVESYQGKQYWSDHSTKIKAIPALSANEGASNTEYWTTYYNDLTCATAPEGTQVFKVALNGSTLTLTEISDRVINMGEGVVLKSNSPSITLASAASTGTKADGGYEGNVLTGTMNSITNPGNAYVLNYTATNGVGFYKLQSDGTIGANKAYLTYDGSAGARQFFLFDEATGISATLNDNGKMINEKCYDLQGRRVAQPTKGLYIVNGKKVVIK